MPEQPQWSERTLDMPPQDPWADPPAARAPYPGTRPQAYEPPTAADRALTQQPGQSRPAPQRPASAPRPPEHPLPADPSPFSRGRAQVNPRTQPFAAEHEPTGTGWPGADVPTGHSGMSWRWSELRRGGEWTTAATLFLFVCWGIWALSSTGSLTTAIIVFVVTLVVGIGVFCLARVVGHLQQTQWVMDAVNWVREVAGNS